MSHYLSYKGDGGIWLNNVAFMGLVEQLLQRAQSQKVTQDEAEDIKQLASMWDEGQFWAGRCFDMSTDLKELKLPQFWSEQLYGLAVDVLVGRIGDEFEVNRKLGLIHGSYAWSGYFGLRARSERPVN